jgi:hypothetical protein
MTDETAKQIADALGRIANAQEAQVMIFQAILTAEEHEQPGVPKTIMTHNGLVEMR